MAGREGIPVPGSTSRQAAIHCDTSLPMVDGVQVVEHTADLAMEVEAESLPQLFDRAALGMLALIEQDDPEPATQEPDRAAGAATQQRKLELQDEDLPGLLVLWLREILYLHQVPHLAYRGAELQVVDERRLHARLHLEPDAYAAVRELKGVTYHGLDVARTDGGWRARIIFDV